MKNILLIFGLLLFSNLNSQNLEKINDGFEITYNVDSSGLEKSKVRIIVKNISKKIKYVSRADYKNEFSLDIKSKGITTFNLSYILVSDPLLNPNTIFNFIKLFPGEFFTTQRNLTTKDNSEINVQFEYFDEDDFKQSTLKLIDIESRIFGLTCQDYVENRFTKNKIKFSSQKSAL